MPTHDAVRNATNDSPAVLDPAGQVKLVCMVILFPQTNGLLVALVPL